MEWKTNKIGERRERPYFALFPIDCEDGKTRWLCRVWVVEEYAYYGGGIDECPSIGWILKEAHPMDRSSMVTNG